MAGRIRFYCDRDHNCKSQASALSVDYVKYIDFEGTSASEEAIKLDCDQNSGCHNIIMDRIKITSAVPGKKIYASCSNAIGTSLRTTVPNVPCLKSGDKPTTSLPAPPLPATPLPSPPLLVIPQPSPPVPATPPIALILPPPPTLPLPDMPPPAPPLPDTPPPSLPLPLPSPPLLASPPQSPPLPAMPPPSPPLSPPSATALSLSLISNGAPPLLAWYHTQSPRHFFQAISLSFPFLLSALVWVHGSNEIRNF
ncbi:unnamed protein product [Prunus armeniaca]